MAAYTDITSVIGEVVKHLKATYDTNELAIQSHASAIARDNGDSIVHDVPQA